MTYAFQADLYCDACAEKIATELRAAGATDTGDSNDFPQLDTSEGESDSPDHCGACGRFLENPLTSDGRCYVVDTLIADYAAGRTESVAWREWAPFYGFASELAPWFDRFDICDAYHAYATDFHGGQASPEYAIHGRLDRMEYRPGLSVREETFAGLSENARGIYLRLASGVAKVRA